MRYSFADFVLDTKAGSVTSTLNGDELKLRPQTFNLLEVLVKNYPKILSRDQLLDQVWGTEHVSSGSLPQAISELRQAFGDDPQQPRFIETIHRRGYRFISPVSVASTRVFLAPYIETAKPKPWRNLVPKRTLATLILALAGGALFVAGKFGSERTAVPGAGGGPVGLSAEARPTVAVIGFHDLSRRDETAWLSSALAELIATELALGDDLNVVSQTTVATMTADLDLASQALPPPVTVEKIQRRLDVDLLVAGSYLRLDGDPAQLRVDLRLIDISTRQPSLTLSETARDTQMLHLVGRLGQRLRERLRTAGAEPRAGTIPPSTAAEELRPTQPLRLYFEAQAAARHFDPTLARQLLEQAVALDPRSPRLALALARVLRDLGEEARARQELARTRDRAGSLPEEERLAFVALGHELDGDREAALDIYRRLGERFPDQSEHALNLARAQITTGRSREMLEQLDGLRQRFQTPATRVRLDLLEAEAASAIAEFERQAEAARRAATAGSELEAAWLEGRAILAWSRAVGKQGDLNRALTLAEQARDLLVDSLDRHRVTLALIELAALHLELGRLQSSRELGEEALALSRRLGNQRAAGLALSLLARQHLYSGEGAEGWALLRRAEDLYRGTGDRHGQALVHGLEAEMLLYQGEVERAFEKNRQARQIWRQLDDRHQLAASQQMAGSLLARLTRFDEALDAWRQATDLYRRLGDQRNLVETETRVAAIYTTRGQLRQAREPLTRALAYHRSAGSARDTARTLYTLALVDLPTGRPEQARATLEEALQIFEDIGDRLGVCFIQRKLGDTAHQLGNLETARELLEQAHEGCRALEHQIATALAASDLGLVAMRQDRLDAARIHLEDAREMHSSMGDRGNAATDDLRLARLDLLAGNASAAEERAARAVAIYASQDSPTFHALALALRSRALAALGRQEEAATLVDQAGTLLEDSQDVLRSLEVEIELARVRGALGEDATAALERIDARARALGYRTLAFEAQLARAELVADLGSEELTALIERARQEGFALMARRMERLKRSTA